MFLNDELFFPFGVFVNITKESDLLLVNQTHSNIVYAYDKKVIDMIHTSQQGKIKVIPYLSK